MNIELNELISALGGKTQTQVETKDLGTQIVVLDRGFVFVGKVTDGPHTVKINGAKNLRKWGTTNGLGELVNGPLSGTVADSTGDIQFPKTSFHFFIQCKSGW